MKRKKIKTILCHMAIITICMGVFCHGYIMGNSLSRNDRVFCFASSGITRDELVESFKDYCSSRNLLTNSSILGASTEWLGTTLTNICNTLGIDMDYLQAQISKETGGNLGVRWLVNATGMGLYNRIFSELLQRENMSVGDEDVNKTVYSGEYFTDVDGNKCLVYYINADSGTYTGENAIGRLTKMGTPYKYTSEDIYDYYVNTYGGGHTSLSDYVSLNYRVYGNYQHTIKYYFYSTTKYYWLVDNKPTSGNSPTAFFRMRIFAKTDNSIGNLTGYGNPAIIRFNNILAFGTVSFDYVNPNRFSYRYIDTITDGDSEPTDVTVTTPPDKQILPNPPENPTTIYPGGGTDDNPDQPGGEPDNPGGDPDNWNPTIPTIPSPTTPDFPSVNLPDIDIPDLPSLNFSLGDLRNKFPFSLPFDIIAILNVLDGEPQAPHIEATVPIGSWYTWEMDFDFAEFDNYARIFRAFEFIGFCIGLAIFTVHFVKG